MFEVITDKDVVRYPRLSSCQNYVTKMKKKNPFFKYIIKTPTGEIQDE